VRYLTFAEVLELHRRVVSETGGATALRDLGALESATAQPRASFGGNDLYPSLEEKAGALAFSLIQNHPFIDGNKRVGHAALETFLVLNGKELSADADESERIILAVASGKCGRDGLLEWIRSHVVSFKK
jgi:death on curing protein